MPRKRNNGNTSSGDDEDYSPQQNSRQRQKKWRANHAEHVDTSHAERNARYRINHPDDHTNTKRQSRWRNNNAENEMSESDRGRRCRKYPDRTVLDRDRRRSKRQGEYMNAEEDEDGVIQIMKPELLAYNLGPRDNICTFCTAIHFRGAHSCCQNGKVFIPPFRKLPEPIFSLLFDINESKRSTFMKDVMKYNTLMSFSSVQYSKVKVNKNGVQVAKAQGAVGHFSSTVQPHKNGTPQFGNYYVYEGEEATALRMANPFINGVDEQIIWELTECLKSHPFAKFYKTMNEIMEKDRLEGKDPTLLRMKIVDPYEYQKNNQLEEHQGIYGKARAGDYVSVFFSCSVDQRVLPRGLMIYPKKRGKTMQPLFPWLKEVNSLCYPIIFPRGEPGYYPKGYPRYEPLPFNDRLQEYIERTNTDGVHIERGWDSEDEKIHRRRKDHSIVTRRSDANLELEDDSDIEAENNDYDVQFNESIPTSEEVVDDMTLEFTERNGEMYPQRRPRRTHSPSGRRLVEIEMSDSGEDEDITREEFEMTETNLPGTSRLVVREDPHGYDDELLADELHTRNTEGDQADIPEQDEEQQDNSDQPEEQDVDDQISDSEDIVDNDNGTKKRQYASMREWALYVNQDRKRFRNRISASGKLGQLFVIDHATRIQQARLNAIEKHHTQFLSSNRKKLIDAFQRTANRLNRTVGCVTTIPATMPGSPRYLQQKYENAITMANKLGKPDLFLTFTCSTKWPEIQAHIKKGETWADHPFLLNEVFKKKKESLLDDVLGKPVKKGSRKRLKGLFGYVRWFAYSIEFQQRGPPHMHLIISLVNHIRTVEQVDSVCSAELPIVDENSPDYERQKRLRDLVVSHMVHMPCEGDSKAYCRENAPTHWKQCRKRFPKEFNERTEFGDRDYPALKRPDNNETARCGSGTKEVIATNQHVVAYNPYLLSKYACHMNLEVISSIKVLKYIFKYLFKGFDRALVECVENVGADNTGSHDGTGEMTMMGHIMYPKNIKLPEGVVKKRAKDAKKILRDHGVPLHDSNGKETLVYNECTFFEDMRALTAAEAAWDIAGYSRAGSSHTVVSLFVHCPGEEPIKMDLDKSEETYAKVLNEEVLSRLKAWFQLNNSTGPGAIKSKECTYDELPKYFTYNKNKWVLRKKDYSLHTLGKIKFVRPRYLEQFAIRLLCMNQRGVTSFEELRTVNGIVHDTFVAAARDLRLMNGEAEWDMCLAEAATNCTPSVLRRLFISILLNCAPVNPEELWETHKEALYANRPNWSDANKEAHALNHIRSGLRSNGMELYDFQLPDVIENDLPTLSTSDSDSTDKNISPSECQKIGDAMYKELTEEQRQVVDRVVDSVQNNTQESFFLEGRGGCGKTFVYTCIYYVLQGKGYKVMCVAHTGVAASLLPQGMTAHRAFGIPLEVEEDMHCKIDLESTHAQDLRNTSLVLWDESPMTDRRIYKAVNELFCFLHPNAGDFFPTTTFLFGGDWRQTLPIVEGVQGQGVLEYTMLRSDMWERLTVLHLTVNQRALKDPQYSQWIQEVGEGSNYLPGYKEDIEIPNKYLVNNESDLIRKMFGDNKIEDDTVTNSSSILTVDNVTALEINEKILKLKFGTEQTMLSRDEFNEGLGLAAIPPELYNMLTPSGMPPHKLKLKEGAVVILLKNIDVYLGICNGLRLRIIKIGKDVLHCKPITGSKRTPKVILLHRMAMTPIRANCKELSFVRWQYPIRLAYSMTINKCQGQTLENVGLSLRTPVFSHGQFYVAVSRAKSSDKVLVYNASSGDKGRTRNIVYKDVLAAI